MTHQDDQIYKIKAKRISWFLWQCLAPPLLLCILYPIGKFVVQANHSFHRTFSDGTLLLFSAMLLIGVLLELQEVQRDELELKEVQRDELELKEVQREKNTTKRKLGLIVYYQLSLLFTVVLLIFYGAIRADMMKENLFSISPLPLKIYIYSYCNIFISLGIICYSTLCIWKATVNSLERLGI